MPELSAQSCAYGQIQMYTLKTTHEGPLKTCKHKKLKHIFPVDGVVPMSLTDLPQGGGTFPGEAYAHARTDRVLFFATFDIFEWQMCTE